MPLRLSNLRYYFASTMTAADTQPQPRANALGSSSREARESASTHSSAHTSTLTFRAEVQQATASADTSDDHFSPGAISGIVIGAFILFAILGGITRLLQKRRAPPFVMHVDPPRAPQSPPMLRNMTTISASNTLHIPGRSLASVHTDSSSSSYVYNPAPSRPYSPVMLASLAADSRLYATGTSNQNISSHGSHHSVTTLPPARLSPNDSPHAPAKRPAPPPTKSSSSSANSGGGGDCAPAPTLGSPRSPP
ncbi:hypothetical protein B0H15DRAFT_53257 [Mycena belliarum]|uniref:Uncharacterized protein n=1 Tax=Mycena belliarum TaxID=1033014 RepID=A0AAD6UAZ0_9AGAR|nr:hypothetical protein B0H15DRAFT_53257 [Mycena belliae]